MTADNVTRFARVDFRSDERVFGIKDENRLLHIYSIGKTGTRKTRRRADFVPYYTSWRNTVERPIRRPQE